MLDAPARSLTPTRQEQYAQHHRDIQHNEHSINTIRWHTSTRSYTDTHSPESITQHSSSTSHAPFPQHTHSQHAHHHKITVTTNSLFFSSHQPTGQHSDEKSVWFPKIPDLSEDRSKWMRSHRTTTRGGAATATTLWGEKKRKGSRRSVEGGLLL